MQRQGSESVAVGVDAGFIGQGNGVVAVGVSAGEAMQQNYGVSVGYYAGNQSQGQNAVALGNLSGQINQGTNSVAIGNSAGKERQGSNSVAIGHGAGFGDQANNSIIISSTGAAVNNTTPGSITIKSNTTDLRSLPDGRFAMNGDPIIGSRSLIKTLSTLRKATMDETTFEGLRDSIGNAIGGLIENLEHDISTMPAPEEVVSMEEKL